MDVIKKIEACPKGPNDRPDPPVKMISIVVEE
jgi:hypothetical protein